MANDLDGNLYITTSNPISPVMYRYNRKDSNFESIGDYKVFKQLDFFRPQSIRFDHDGNFYETEDRLIRKVILEGLIAFPFAGYATQGIGSETDNLTLKKRVDSLRIAKMDQNKPLRQNVTPASKDYLYLSELLSLNPTSNDTAYVVLVWAGWCAPCNLQIAELEKAQKKLRPGPYRFVILHALSRGDEKKQINMAQTFLSERKNTFHYVPFPWVQNIAVDSKVFIDGQDVSNIPITMIYKTGKIIFASTGVTLKENELYNEINKYLRQ